MNGDVLACLDELNLHAKFQTEQQQQQQHFSETTTLSFYATSKSYQPPGNGNGLYTLLYNSVLFFVFRRSSCSTGSLYAVHHTSTYDKGVPEQSNSSSSNSSPRASTPIFGDDDELQDSGPPQGPVPASSTSSSNVHNQSSTFRSSLNLFSRLTSGHCMRGSKKSKGRRGKKEKKSAKKKSNQKQWP
ncbi:hypothetical protein TYRP_006527 [Tyrophagus putrescentiae]|nr:hypothetical protein TYRP_006527 [Tyrophagus putrescentiae]